MKKILLALSLFSSSAFAGTLACTGTVEQIGLHAPDKIMLRLSSMNTAVFICSTKNNWSVAGTSYQTGVETCNAIWSMLMHAKSTKAEMGKVWFDGEDVPTDCNQWETWKAANIRHFLY